jgi:peptide-methionine (S)-S-oxide reductase
MSRISRCLSPIFVSIVAAVTISCARAEETSKPLPAPIVDSAATAAKSETAVLAGGCFWGIQGVFQHVRGVTQVLAGYSGGEKVTAEYEIVSNGATGHAESVKIVFDPKQVSFGQILRIYFSVMDPTELNRQGPDRGTQYRSEIFATSAAQQHVAQAYVAQLTKARAFSQPIVTRIGAFEAFYPAEDYHQDYLIHHPSQPYIAINDLPKVAALKRLYPQLYRDAPVMVFPNRASL